MVKVRYMSSDGEKYYESSHNRLHGVFGQISSRLLQKASSRGTLHTLYCSQSHRERSLLPLILPADRWLLGFHLNNIDNISIETDIAPTACKSILIKIIVPIMDLPLSFLHLYKIKELTGCLYFLRHIFSFSETFRILIVAGK